MNLEVGTVVLTCDLPPGTVPSVQLLYKSIIVANNMSLDIGQNDLSPDRSFGFFLWGTLKMFKLMILIFFEC